MNRKTLRNLTFVIFLTIPVISFAQVVTSNAYVEADVSDDGTGLVRCYYANTDHSQYILNPDYSSYLTVSVNGFYYTNNPYPDWLAPFSFQLTGGVTTKIADTIETVWQVDTADAFEIIQDIYPVAFPYAESGQIVYKFSIHNEESIPMPVQAQYLLDIDLGAPGNVNNNAPVTTRYGYITDWRSFPTSAPIPPYYIATLDAVTNNNFPTLIAMGYNNDSLAPGPMGLMQPDAFTYVNWQTVVQQWTWGFPTTPGLKDSDAALLIEWPPDSVPVGGTLELGRGSYGSASCTPVTIGNLDLFMVHPSHLVWNQTDSVYIPNRFSVDAIVWNPNDSAAKTASGTLSITNSATNAAYSPIRIVSPLPTSSNGYSQTHSMAIPAEASAVISWEDTVMPGVLVNCSTDSSYDMTFEISATGVPGPYSAFFSCPIFVDCPEKDVTPPRHSPHVAMGDTNHCGNPIAYMDSVYDDNVTDQGVQSISWFVTPSADAIEVDTGSHSPCAKSEVPIMVTQIDSSASCVYFTFTDCAGNISFDSICFAGCGSEFIDTLPPKFGLLKRYDLNAAGDSSCGFKCSEWSVTDSVIEGLQHDAGIAYVTLVDSTNMSFALKQPVTPGMREDSFTTCVIDSQREGSIAISLADGAGNISFKTITYCPVSEAVTTASTQAVVLSIFPNPVEGEATILLSAAPSADVEIFDVLGREVDRFRVDGSYDWETGGFPAGTYIIHASSGSQMISKRIIKR
jgi:hypothetical protein